MSTSYSPAPEATQESEIRPFPYAEVADQVGSGTSHKETPAAGLGEGIPGRGEMQAQREAAARDAGRQEGEAQGRAAGEQHLGQVRESVAAALAGFAHDRSEYHRQVESEVVQLAL